MTEDREHVKSLWWSLPLAVLATGGPAMALNFGGGRTFIRWSRETASSTDLIGAIGLIAIGILLFLLTAILALRLTKTRPSRGPCPAWAAKFLGVTLTGFAPSALLWALGLAALWRMWSTR